MALVEHLQRRGEDRVLAIARRVPALNRDQRGDHRVPPADRVGEQLAPELAVLAAAEPLGGALGELDVEHVQVAAATAQPDHLPVERADQIDVIGLQIPEHQRQDAEPGQRQRHPPDAARLAEPLQAHHERRRGREQAGALKPADRIPAHRRTRQQVLSERRADQRRAGADRERPQPTRLHARAAPLRRRLQIHAATSARPVPPAGTGQPAAPAPPSAAVCAATGS